MLTNGKVLSTTNTDPRTTTCAPFALNSTTVTLGGTTVLNATDGSKINVASSGEMNVGSSSNSGGKLNINTNAYIKTNGKCYVDGEIIIRDGGNIDV